MTGIVEHVATAVRDAGAMSMYLRVEDLIEAQTKAAIRATLEYARVHITDAMLEGSRRTGIPDFYLPTDDADKFRAMITALLAELETKP